MKRQISKTEMGEGNPLPASRGKVNGKEKNSPVKRR